MPTVSVDKADLFERLGKTYSALISEPSLLINNSKNPIYSNTGI